MEERSKTTQLKLSYCALILTAIITISIILNSCNFKTPSKSEFSETKEIIGTFVKISAYGDNSEKAVNLAFERAFVLEKILSLTVQDSEINRLNEKAFKEPYQVSDALFAVIKRGLYYSNLSENALDISAGKLIDLWVEAITNRKVPSQVEIDRLKGRNSVRGIVLDENNKTVKFKDDRVKINLGAVGKGYFADEIKRILKENGIESALINLGGNVHTVGTKKNGEKWKVGIADPSNPDRLIASVNVDGQSVVTSGDYEKFFEENGVRYHHILDTSNGYPAGIGAQSDYIAGITVIGDSSTDCDALSTAAFVLGEKAALKLFESLEGFEAIIVTKSGEIITTAGVSKYQFKKDA